MINAVFVYGTLKRGQCRESMWPASPRSVQATWVHGELFGRHDYPAMIAGGDRIFGECWRFDSDVIDTVLERLDQIEGANQPGQADLYRRVITEVRSHDDQLLGRAWTYHYATDPRADGFCRIEPHATGCVEWP